MAPSGEGASAAPSSSAYEGGGGGGGEGVGGKFRKRPFRKTHATPYDRPPTALRNPSWLSKLVVDPASKLIAASAQRFFASVFLKRLPPPPPPPPPIEPNQDSSDKHPEAVLKKQAEAREAAIDDNQNLTYSTDGGFSELEQLLKQKTFTRSEIDRLTELLRSRAVNLPVEDGVMGTEANTSKQVANFGRQQQFLVSLEEKRTEGGGSHGLNSTPDISKRVLEEDIASPAGIAKAYMGNQVSKVSPSMLGLRSRALREDVALLSNVPFTPKSTIISSSKNASTHVEVPENGFTTPRSRGKSAIYNMARTPYSRVHQTAFEKGSGGFRNYAYGRPLLPALSLKEPDGEHESNKALKRRSSVLDEDLGSGGPVRRIRHNHNLLSHKLSLPHGIGGVSDAVQHPLSLTQKFPSTKEWQHEGSKVIGENDGNHTPRTSYAHVPSKSSEMAARILEHLEKMTPKEKSAESKLIAAREKTPAKLTTDMLRGQVLKSLEDMDSSKFHKMEDWSHGNSLSAPAPSPSPTPTPAPAPAPRKEDRKETNGPPKFDSQRDMSTPVENCSITASVKGVLTSVEASELVANSVAQHPQKKRAFMMSAHEDSVELDDDINFNGPASEPLPDGRGNLETSARNQNSTSVEKVLLDKTAVLPETRTPPEPTFGKRSDLEIGNAANVGRKKSDVTFPASLASSSTSQLVTLPPSALGFENPKQAIEKVPVFQNSSLLSVTELSGPKPLPWTNQKPEISNSSDGAGSGVTDASLGIPVSEKGKDTNSQEAKSNGELVTVDSVAFNTTSSGGMSSIVPIRSNSGPLSISPSTLSSPLTSTSTGFAHQFLSNSTSNLASSFSAISSATTTSIPAASSSSPVVFTAAPPVMPVFKFGSSIDPSMSVSSAADAESSVIKTNTEKEANSDSSNNLTFGGTSFGLVGTGSSIFGLSSTITSSTAFSQSQGSLSSTGGGSMSSLQSSVAGSGSASVTQGLPNQFSSSASSPVFGTSGVVSFTFSNTLFSSPTTTTQLFGMGNGGLGTSASSAETKSADSGSGATSSIFNTGVNAPSSSSEANAISSNGVSPPTTFSFGASSSAATSVTSSSSSGSTAAMFSFGVSSSSLGSNAVSSSSGGSSSIFGGSSLSSSTETNPASSSSATPGIFGSSWQASKSPPFISTFNSSPSTAFSFGSGSASFASNNATSMVFGSSTGASSTGPVFSFTKASVANSSSPSLFNAQPFFGNSTPAFSAPPGNNDQINTEDSMAEDPVQSSLPVTGFGQQPVSPSPGGFVFGSMVPSQTVPFQFGGQQNQAAPQNPSPFQASGSLEFDAGGSFSLGSGDKSGRKIVKVNRNRHRRR